MPLNPEIRTGLELLRPIFAGIPARHDRVLSRIVIAEDNYREFLSGPGDPEWGERNMTAGSALTLRERDVIPITEEEAEQLKIAEPDTEFAHWKDGTGLFRVQTGILSVLLFNGSIPGFAEFRSAAHDAGLFLIRYLHETAVDLKLPELAPIDGVRAVRSVSGDTGIPGNLPERWVVFLHMLGWQATGFSPLKAERVLWHEHFRVTGDPEELHKFLERAPFAEKIRDKIPIPPRYFASTLLTDVSTASVHAIDALLAGKIDAPLFEVQEFKERLAAIQPGRPDASKYHALVAEILSVLFEPDLHDPVPEESINEDRGFIDIVFRNSAERGYFYDLQSRHGIKCPVVFFECKNYSSDIGPPEFAQLISRFSSKRSNVGFIVCRTIEDEQRALKSCKDRFNSHEEHIVVLSDADLIALLEIKATANPAGVSKYLHDKWRPIFMNQ